MVERNIVVTICEIKRLLEQYSNQPMIYVCTVIMSYLVFFLSPFYYRTSFKIMAPQRWSKREQRRLADDTEVDYVLTNSTTMWLLTGHRWHLASHVILDLEAPVWNMILGESGVEQWWIFKQQCNTMLKIPVKSCEWRSQRSRNIWTFHNKQRAQDRSVLTIFHDPWQC